MAAVKTIAVALTLTVLGGPAYAQRGGAASWAPKPVEPTKYVAPHKPHTKISDIKARHAGKREWRQVTVDDEHLYAEYIYSPPGAKVSPRFHPDTRIWWVVMEGQIRFEIEGQQPFVATRRSMVQVPAQTIYSMETLGDQPSLRFEVNIAKAKTLFPEEVEPPKIPGINWIRVTLGRKPFGYDRGNKPHVPYDEFAANAEKKSGPTRFVHDDRAVANFLYGYEKSLPAFDPRNKGHYHPECAEFWLIMTGQVRYVIEGQPQIIATEGDVVYAPKFTFHAPRWHGEAASCRLAMNGYPNISHLFEAKPKQ